MLAGRDVHLRQLVGTRVAGTALLDGVRGHSSLTQYIQLYLGGFGLELDDLKSLRTWGSLTPGHPEVNHTDGVEITTGPLGQGLASAVGMAMASRKERGLFDASAARTRTVSTARVSTSVQSAG